MENLIYAGVGLVALLTVGFIVTRLYVRATKETAFVRTGLGGEKVVLNGGAMVIPVLHETMRVGMNTVGLEVKRENEDSLITSDSMLVNVHSQFFVRVSPTVEAISKAAQTLGKRTLDASALKVFIEGKFVDALRNVAASMSLDDLNQKRQEFVRAVQEACQHDLAANGLELESVSLTGLVQTDKRYFNPDNALHAQGLTELTRRTSERAVVRNEIETQTRVEIETKNLETNKISFNIAQEAEFARLEQDKAVRNRAAEQAAEVAAIEAKRQADIAAANAQGEQAAAQAKVLAEQETQTKTIRADAAIQLARQERDIAVAEASRKQSSAQAEADLARAEAVRASQAVITAEKTAVAEREKAVLLVEARRVAEQQAIGVTVQAAAERDAAQARAEAVRIAAEGEASAVRIAAEGEAAATTVKAEAQRVTYEVEAAGKRAVLEAANVQSPETMEFQNRQKLMDTLPAIIRETVKPMENIDSIRITDFGGGFGAPGTVYGGGESTGVSGGSLADNMYSAALRYRAHAPLVDGMLSELGVAPADLSGGLEGLLNSTAAPAPEPKAQTAKAWTDRRPAAPRGEPAKN